MNVTLDPSRRVLAVREQQRPGDNRTALHKYAVAADNRRRGIAWGRHGEPDDLSRVVARHRFSAEFQDGVLLSFDPTPDPEVDAHLSRLGVVLDGAALDDVSAPTEAASGPGVV